MSLLRPYAGMAYRYRGFGDFSKKIQERTERMFSKCELNFSSALKFNDPFECNPAVEYTAGEFRKYLEKIAKKKGIRVSSTLISEQMREYKESGFQGDYQKYLSENIGICCMSKKPDIVTQWAYYAENGKGFCIGYEVGRISEVPCVEVSYGKNRPIIDVVKFQENTEYRSSKLEELISRKASNWSHEEEVRLFSGAIGVSSIPKETINALILGAFIEHEKRDWLVEMAKQHIPSLKILSAELCSKEFKIELRPYL